MIKNKNNKKIIRKASVVSGIRLNKNKKKIDEEIEIIESDENNRVFLISLIIFVVVSVTVVFVIKLADLGYLGKKSVVIENSEMTTTGDLGLAEGEGATKEVQGYVASIDKEAKAISVKGMDLAQNNEQIDLTFKVEEGTEIFLADKQEKISLDDLFIFDSVIVSANESEDGNWVAEKIQVIETNILGARVSNIEQNKLIVLKDLGEAGAPIAYSVTISSATKIIIKDYSKAIQAESNTFDATKVTEEAGKKGDIENNAFVIIYAKDGNIPRNGEDFEASKIEIILNQ